MYKVICGNIGTVYSGDSEVVARAVFKAYVGQSKTDRGRAGHEIVTLLYRGEIAHEYIPANCGNEFCETCKGVE